MLIGCQTETVNAKFHASNLKHALIFREEDAEVRKFRNKKKLTALVAFFMMVFVVGAAFAFGPGQLGVIGFVGVNPELSMIWQAAPTTTGTGGVSTTVNTAQVIDGYRVNQGIAWAVGFMSEGTATLTATAFNNGAVAAHITGLGMGTGVMDGLLTTPVITSTATGLPPAWPIALNPTETHSFNITIAWDGEVMPELFGPDMDFYDAVDWGLDLLEDEGYEFLDGFWVYFDYIQRP